MQASVQLLAQLWESAWTEGNGESNVRSTAALDETEAMDICRPQKFLPSCSIAEIGPLL
jgi:hypothetical protein